MIPQGGHLAGRHPVLGGRIRHAVHCERVGVPLAEAAGADAAALWRLVTPEEQVLGLDAAGYELLQLLLAADGGPRGCRIAAALLCSCAMPANHERECRVRPLAGLYQHTRF